MERIKFQIEIDKVLKLLTSDIYDSPYALLRENVQNAYDAILMRMQKDPDFTPAINIDLVGSEIAISDNGIGMTRAGVENNYWKAGSSGKNNDEARRAGVVGTFGIGAMANFGICKHLKVKTHHWGDSQTIISEADRDNLSVASDCIEVDSMQDFSEPGTTVYATLGDGVSLNQQEAIDYLRPYVQYLTIPVSLNGSLVSQKEITSFKEEQNAHVRTSSINENGLKLDLKVQIQNYNNGQISLSARNIVIGNNPVTGEIFLEQGTNYIYGLRNNFGLAAIPVNSTFNFGGIVNLSALQPTAGREALSRDSIDVVSKIVTLLEKHAATILSEYDICDANRQFLTYIQNTRSYGLAGKIKIKILPGEEFILFEKLSRQIDGKNVYYYTGTDNQIIEEYSNENSFLLILSKENPRRAIQLKVVTDKKIEQISDSPTILHEYQLEDLSSNEVALTLRVSSTLKDDYLIGESKVVFAKISHNAPNIVIPKDGVIYVYLSRESNNVQQVLNIYKEDPKLFDGFVKDFIRNYLYPKLAPYVPSSTKQGADALYKILQKNKELYTIESEEMGEIESLMKDYVAGKIDLAGVFKVSSRLQNTQAQTVRAGQIGTVENELSSIINLHGFIREKESVTVEDAAAKPPIKLLSNGTSKKMLKTDAAYPQLNNFTLFLALSDKIYSRQLDFFLEPHTTKVIYGMHKIVYIFTHASGRISMYYEIELKDKLPNELTGGKVITTTTIISKNRLFVPVARELIPHFNIKNETLSFYVRFDTITDGNIDD